MSHDTRNPPTSPALARTSIATLVLALALITMAPPASADHANPPCFDDHEGRHAFPLTGAKAEMELANDPRLGPFAGKVVELEFDGPTGVDAIAVSPTKMDTEIVDLALVGTHPDLGVVTVIENRLVVSPGVVNAYSSTQCYPASSSFSVYFETRINGIPAHSDNPKFMSATLNSIPPGPSEFYEGPTTLAFYSGAFHGDPLFPDHFVVGWLRTAEHTPTPPPPELPPLPEPGPSTVGGTILGVESPPPSAAAPASLAILAAAVVIAARRR